MGGGGEAVSPAPWGCVKGARLLQRVSYFWDRGVSNLEGLPRTRVGSVGQPGRLLLAQRGLALAAGPGETGESQLLLVGAHLTLQAEGHLLVTGAQLLLTPAPFVSCGVQEGGSVSDHS